jgi:hypothetical protein
MDQATSLAKFQAGIQVEVAENGKYLVWTDGTKNRPTVAALEALVTAGHVEPRYGGCYKGLYTNGQIYQVTPAGLLA